MTIEISPCLWFDHNAEAAVAFYMSLFPEGRILNTSYYGEDAPLPAGTVLTIDFNLNGQDFIALNAGPWQSFSPAISFLINCVTQEQVDNLWEGFLEGGKPMQCGWITDKFGVTWQVVPEVLDRYLNDPDPVKAKRVMDAMLQMVKLESAVLKQAYDGESLPG